MIKLFVGYDLGDGETVVSYYKTEKNEKNGNLEKKGEGKFLMPSTNINGTPIPTAYAKTKDEEIVWGDEIISRANVQNVVSNFKKQPSSLLPKITDIEMAELTSIFNNNEIDCWSLEEIGNNKELLNLHNRIIQFTDSLFSCKEFNEQFKTLTLDMNPENDLLIFCVGHPTKWTVNDIAIYESIIRQTIIGKEYFEVFDNENVKRYKSTFYSGGESRAAFLYARDKYMSKENGVWVMDKSRLVIDVGSSTIDLTSFKKTNDIEKAKGETGHKETGLPFLGARILDWFIFDWFMQKTNNILKPDFEVDKESKNKLLLQCRVAKEKLYTAISSMLKKHPEYTPEKLDDELKPIKIEFPNPSGGDLSVKLTPSILSEIENTPIAYILKEYLGNTEEQINQVKNQSWKEVYEHFLSDEMQNLKKLGYELEEIILTGSASKMPFIHSITVKVVKEVFSNVNVYKDTDPGYAIAGGLPLMGVSQEKSESFRADINDFIHYGLKKKIRVLIPSLADTLGGIISNLTIDEIVIPTLNEWKTHQEISVNDLMSSIRIKCTKKNLANVINNDTNYLNVVNTWTSSLFLSINQELNTIFDKYDVGKEKMDVIRKTYANSDISIGGLTISDTLALPLNVVVNIISYSLCVVILAIAMVFIPKVIVIVGAKIAGKSVQSVIDEIQNGITESLSRAHIPPFFKGSAYNKALKELESKRDEIKMEVSKKIKSEETINEYVKDIANTLKPKIAKAIDVINYYIEDRVAN